MFSPHEKYSALKSLERAWEEVNKLPTTTPCSNCRHFSAAFCNLWKAVIPQEHTAKGCEKWIFAPDSPPF